MFKSHLGNIVLFSPVNGLCKGRWWPPLERQQATCDAIGGSPENVGPEWSRPSNWVKWASGCNRRRSKSPEDRCHTVWDGNPKLYIYEINCALADVILWNEVNNLALKDARSSRVFPTCEVDTNLTAHSAKYAARTNKCRVLWFGIGLPMVSIGTLTNWWNKSFHKMRSIESLYYFVIMRNITKSSY